MSKLFALGVACLLSLTTATEDCASDVFLVADRSGSIGPRQWPALVDYLKIRVSGTNFTGTPEGNRIGVLTFANDAVVECPLSHDKQGLIDCIDSIVYRHGYTNTPLALETANAELTSNANKPSQVIELVTDGAPQVLADDGKTLIKLQSETIAAAKNIKDEEKLILAIGVGHVQRDLLEAVSSGPEYNFLVAGFDSDDLNKLAGLIGASCTPIVPPELCAHDLILVADRSGSVGNTNWQHMISYMKARIEGINGFTGKDDGVRAGVVSFATGVKVECAVTNDQAQLVSCIEGLEYKHGYTNTPEALETAVAQLEGSDKTTQVIEVVTDGHPQLMINGTLTTLLPETLAVADAAKADAKTILAIGIGNVDPDFLEAMSSGPDFTTLVDDFDPHVLVALAELIASRCQPSANPRLNN